MGKKSTSKTSEKDPRLKQIGDKLITLRKQCGYTSSDSFAFDHGISRVQYWRMENGQNFTLDSLFKVLDALKVTPYDFFEGIGKV